MKMFDKIKNIYLDRFSTFDKFKENYVKFRVRSNRGDSFPGIAEIKGIITGISAGGIMVLLIDRYFGFLIPIWLIITIYFLQKVMDYLLGKLDEKVLKFWQVENDYNTRKINPFNQEILAKIDKLLEKNETKSPSKT